MIEKIKRLTTKLTILILSIGIILTSQGIVLCFEPNNVCKLELKISKCDLSASSANTAETPSLEQPTCHDRELDFTAYGNNSLPTLNHPCTKEKVEKFVFQTTTLKKTPLKKTDIFINPSVKLLSSTKLLI